VKSYELARSVLKKLEENGYEAFIVGGFVRDRFLGIVSEDIDITTNALPKTIEEIFPKTKATGKKYGTVTVFIENHGFEVTTYRIDDEYLNNRKPKSVSFTKKLVEDLKRRDFTINALALDYRGEVIDLFGGKRDLDNQLIRAIGEADERFKEDALRILRAIRFVAKLNFNIEEATLKAMREDICLLKNIANERIISELKNIFKLPYKTKAVLYLEKCNFSLAFKELDKGIKAFYSGDVDIDFSEFFALSMYLEKMDIPSYWRFSNNEVKKINLLKDLLEKLEIKNFNPYLVYKYGLKDCLRTNQIRLLLNHDDEAKNIKSIYEKLPIRALADLAFTGKDFLELKKLNNQRIGEVLELMAREVVELRLKNTYEELKAFATEIMEKD
jgi:tRNA nucleotidyltransferase (CCA-adding enzyme)